MRKIKSKVIIILTLLTLVVFTSAVAKAENATESTAPLEETDVTITKSVGATVKLNGVEVSKIIPNEYSFIGDTITSYDVVLPIAGYSEPAKVSIPVVVEEEGYLAFELNGTSINDMVYGEILCADGTEAPDFFCIGNFLKGDRYNTSRGASIYEPGVYYIVVSVTGTDMAQEFNIGVTFTRTESLEMVNSKNMLISGMGEKGIFMQVDSSKYGGKLTLSLDNIEQEYGFDTSYFRVALCDSKKKQIGSEVRLNNTGDVTTWELGSGTYYIRMVNVDNMYSVKPVLKDYLKTPSINKVKINATEITGTATEGTTVIVKVGTKKYTTTATNEGNYSVNINKILKNSVITVYVKNSEGLYSKINKITVK